MDDDIRCTSTTNPSPSLQSKRTSPHIVLAILLAQTSAFAHIVSWWQNEDGLSPTTPLVIAYQSLDDMNQYVRVKPSSGETCTVVVHLDPVQSSYLTATVGPNPANT